MSVRQPAVAGAFYPGEATALRREVQGYLDGASSLVQGEVRAVVAPHAGYIYCGRIAGEAFHLLGGLDQAKRWRVLHLGPSHHLPFRGAVLSTAARWRTPLGEVPVEQPAPWAKSALLVRDDAPHDPEHCLEVQLPFLQLALTDFAVVPLLTGEVDPVALADELAQAVDDDTVVVVSTDLSHYRPDHVAREVDEISNEAIPALDIELFARQGDACGKTAVLVLMHLARRLGWRGQLLAYATSADALGDRSHVVGYGAYAFAA